MASGSWKLELIDTIRDSTCDLANLKDMGMDNRQSDFHNVSSQDEIADCVVNLSLSIVSQRSSTQSALEDGYSGRFAQLAHPTEKVELLQYIETVLVAPSHN